MNDGLAAGHGCCNGVVVADIALDEGVVRIVRDGIKVCEVSGVGQFVVVNDTVVLGQAQEVSNEIASDKAGAPGDKIFIGRGPRRREQDE